MKLPATFLEATFCTVPAVVLATSYTLLATYTAGSRVALTDAGSYLSGLSGSDPAKSS